MTRIWRLTPATHPDPDGEGARRYGGRWNPRGIPVVYTSSSLSLAALEVLVHVGDPRNLPDNLVSLSAIIPDDLRISTISASDLPRQWRRYVDHPELQQLGAVWYQEHRSATLQVPSAVIPEESTFLLNPDHPDFPCIRWDAAEPFQWDPRLER